MSHGYLAEAARRAGIVPVMDTDAIDNRGVYRPPMGEPMPNNIPRRPRVTGGARYWICFGAIVSAAVIVAIMSIVL